MIIKKLTKKMESTLGPIRDKWIARGRCTTPIDEVKARLGIKHIYSSLGMPHPEMRVIDNPLEMERVSAELRGIKQSRSTNNNLCIYEWFGWLAYAEVFAPYLDKCKEAADLGDLYQHLHIINPLDRVCLVSQNPISISVDDVGRLHSTTGPAIEYAGGFVLYRYRGVAVPKEVILRPDLITADSIQKEQNQEVKRCMIEIMGGERFVKELGAERVNTDEYGTLWKKVVDRGLPVVAYAQLINSTPEPDGSSKIYWLRVDPQSQTCHEAVGRSFLGDNWKMYKPVVET